ncbi:MAG: protein kinase [bacterium]
MSQPSDPHGARSSPMPLEGIAAKRPPRRISPNLLAARAHQVASHTDAVAIKAGTLIGDYSVQKRLDEGGMGTVYAAVHPVIGKKVAIKVLHPHVARQEEAVARFIQEARAVNAIGHPGIVDIFGFGRFVDGRHYIIMEYLEGQQLLAYLNERGPIPPLDVLPLSRLLAESLAAAHAKGVVHRDMKPENVFLGVDPRAKKHEPWPPRTKILDFGLAKLIEAEFTDKKPRTRAGVTVGTPYYMSPEQCRGKAIDRRADVYALGVMMYEMVTGRVPFYASESVDVLYMHLTQQPEAPSSHRAVPPDIEALILRCMAKVPDERPKNMEVLIAELDRVSAILSPGVPASDGRPEQVLVAEAEAFFGGVGSESVDLPPVLESKSATDRNRITLPMSLEGIPAEAKSSGAKKAAPPQSDAPPPDKTEANPGAQAGRPDPEAASRESGETEAAGESAKRELPTIPSTPVRTYSSPAGRGVPSLPTPPVGLPAETGKPAPAAARPVSASVDLETTDKVPVLKGMKTDIIPAARSVGPPRSSLWVAVVLEGIVIVLLAVLLVLRSGEAPSRGAPTAQASDLGGVELQSSAPVDVSLSGRTLARQVRHLVVARLPAGSTQTFLVKGADGTTQRVKVRVVGGRNISVTVP